LVVDFAGRDRLKHKGAWPTDDSLRCWRMRPFSIGPVATRRADNAVTIVRDSPSGRVTGDASAASTITGVSGGTVRPEGRQSRRNEALDKEGPQRLLEGSDGTGSVGKGGLKMSEDLRRGSVLRPQFGRWAAPEECGANLALAPLEALPEAPPGPVAERAVAAADGGANASGNGTLEEAPQTAGGQAEASDFVGQPDAEGAAAAGPVVAVAAEDPPGPHRLVLAAIIEAAQEAVPNQRADSFAVWTGRLSEPFGNGDPFFDGAVKPVWLAHDDRTSATGVRFYPRGAGAG